VRGTGNRIAFEEVAARRTATCERDGEVFRQGQRSGGALHRCIGLERFAHEGLGAFGTATRFVSGKIITTFLTAACRVASWA